MWKLRSMVPNAEAVLEAHLASNPDARAEWDLNQKLNDDPRITRFGRALRRSSFDELPQLWNVLQGEMSLVGPRPMMCSQKSLYPGQEYYLMRPGVTGFWQVSARNQTSFRERAEFDRAYYAAISFEHRRAGACAGRSGSCCARPGAELRTAPRGCGAAQPFEAN